LYSLDLNNEFPIVDQFASAPALSARALSKPHHIYGKMITIKKVMEIH
jgi:hypothetical protein